MGSTRNPNFSNVAGICPPLVDVHHYYDSKLEWAHVHSQLGIEHGSFNTMDQVDGDVFETITQNHRREVRAGSSILGLLAATPSEVRKEGCVSLYASLPLESEGVSEEKKCIIDTCNRLDLRTAFRNVAGKIATAHVLVETETGQRSFIKASGTEEAEIPKDTANSITAIDLYELASGTSLSRSLDNYIASKDSSIFLLLGSHSIIDQSITERVDQWVRRGNIHTLCGNFEEFSTLLTYLYNQDGSSGFFDAAMKDLSACVDLIVTRGEDGAQLYADGSLKVAVQSPRIEVVSTSGAGDALAGRYIGEIISGRPREEALLNGAEYASLVACSLEDIL